LIFNVATTVINNYIIMDARMKGRPFFCFIIMSFLSSFRFIGFPLTKSIYLLLISIT